MVYQIDPMTVAKPWLWLAGALTLAGLTGLAGYQIAVPPVSPPPSIVTPRATKPAATLVVIPFESAGIDAIEARRELTPALFRLAENGAILVLDVPDLHMQALMLNRVAALIEKANMPRDRVVTEVALNNMIQAAGGTPDTYYYGHDYSAASLAHFFSLAETDKIQLNPYETWLRDVLIQEKWLTPGATGALISIPGVMGDVDPAARTVIFRHELSHAVYFTDPGYAEQTKQLWNDRLTEQEREAIRALLRADGYDTANEDLMMNEAQAYLIHTHDERYFLPSLAGIGPAREAELRGAFIDGIGQTWLRDCALTVAPVLPLPPIPPDVTSAPWSAPVRPSRPVHLGGARPSSRRPVPR